MVIRKAAEQDFPTLAILNKRLIEDEAHPNPMTIDQLAERMAGWLEAEYVGFVYLIAEQIVAYCIYQETENYYYLRHLYVDRDVRRQGIATRFLDWMYANHWQDKEVRLDVLAENQRALAFYQHYGFRTRALRMEK